MLAGESLRPDRYAFLECNFWFWCANRPALAATPPGRRGHSNRSGRREIEFAIIKRHTSFLWSLTKSWKTITLCDIFTWCV